MQRPERALVAAACERVPTREELRRLWSARVGSVRVSDAVKDFVVAEEVMFHLRGILSKIKKENEERREVVEKAMKEMGVAFFAVNSREGGQVGEFRLHVKGSGTAGVSVQDIKKALTIMQGGVRVGRRESSRILKLTAEESNEILNQAELVAQRRNKEAGNMVAKFYLSSGAKSSFKNAGSHVELDIQVLNKYGVPVVCSADGGNAGESNVEEEIGQGRRGGGRGKRRGRGGEGENEGKEGCGVEEEGGGGMGGEQEMCIFAEEDVGPRMEEFEEGAVEEE